MKAYLKIFMILGLANTNSFGAEATVSDGQGDKPSEVSDRVRLEAALQVADKCTPADLTRIEAVRKLADKRARDDVAPKKFPDHPLTEGRVPLASKVDGFGSGDLLASDGDSAAADGEPEEGCAAEEPSK